ncbi:MAG: hypothetical protein OEL55_05175, partial [Desulfobulbaceae bacterium]|nr:hypothetical protein [Desulfobulbaceae bacterium]
MKTAIFILMLALLPVVANADEIKPFTTDACSAFPNGTLEHQSLWSECCIKHDLAYWQGGTYHERLAADKSLEQCVARVGEPEIARLMLAGVRVGGSPYYPTTYRWGYGWPYLRGYKALGGKEKGQIRQRLDSMRVLLKSIQKELEPKDDTTAGAETINLRLAELNPRAWDGLPMTVLIDDFQHSDGIFSSFICDEIIKRMTADPQGALRELNLIENEKRSRALGICFSPEVGEGYGAVEATAKYADQYPGLI